MGCITVVRLDASGTKRQVLQAEGCVAAGMAAKFFCDMYELRDGEFLWVKAENRGGDLENFFCCRKGDAVVLADGQVRCMAEDVADAMGFERINSMPTKDDFDCGDDGKSDPSDS